MAEKCAEKEREGLLSALNGGFVMPSSGGSPVRGRLDILPTGRNLVAVDPRMIPTPTATAIGKRAAGEFVSRYVQDHGDYPENIVIDVWGSATLRNGGDEIAQALYLMGVNPLWDNESHRVTGFEIIPDSEMQWPRVDVCLRISGMFRDMFPNLILLFDDAVQAIAKLQGRKSTWRIFGNAPNAYGAGTTGLIDSGNWEKRGDLGQAYINASQFAYGRGADGELQPVMLKERIANADALIHVQDAREMDVLSGADFADSEGGFSAAASMLGGAPALYHIDTSRPDSIKTRTLAEEISLTLHARAVNPQWIEGQMRHGYAGGAALADVVDNLFAFAATSNAVTSASLMLWRKAICMMKRCGGS
jgi:cobaltochelatase CobN